MDNSVKNEHPQLSEKELKILKKASRPFWKKKRFIIPGVIILLIIIGSLANGGGNNGSTPVGGQATDTTKTNTPTSKKEETNKPTITMAEFNKIQNGMSYEEVTKIIGGPGELTSETGTKGDQFYTAMYSYKGESGLGANAILTFQDDKLMNKTQMGLK